MVASLTCLLFIMLFSFICEFSRFSTRAPRPFKRGRRVFITNDAGQRDTHTEKNEVVPLPAPYTKIHSEWTEDLTIRAKTIKLSEENMSTKLLDSGLRDDVWI